MANTKLRTVMTKYVADAGDHVYAATQVAKATDLVSLGFEQQAEKATVLQKKWEELSKGLIGLELHDVFKSVSDGTKDATGGMVDLQASFAGFQAAGPIGALLGLHGAAVKLLEALPRVPGPINDIYDSLKQHEAAAKADAIAWEQADESLRRVNITFVEQRKVLTDINYQLQVGTALRKSYAALGAYGRGSFAGLTGRVAGVADDSVYGARGGVGAALEVKQGQPSILDQTAAGFTGNASQDRAVSALDSVFTRWQELEEQRRNDAFSKDLFASMPKAAPATGIQDLEELFAKQNATNYAAYRNQKGATFLENTFGKLDDFNAYKTAFDGLSGAVTAGYDAMVDGTMSFGAAFKRAIADALKSAGAEMAVMALKETAYGVASLALGPIGGVSAAGHFKAAGLFAIGAAAAGVAAHGLGTSAGAGASSSSSSSPQTYKSPQGGQGAPQQGPIVVYGDSFYEDSPRGRTRTARRVVARALGNSAVRPS